MRVGFSYKIWMAAVVFSFCVPLFGTDGHISNRLPLIPLSETLSRLSYSFSIPIVAWVGDPATLVPWEESAQVEEILSGISVVAPAVWEWRDGILLVTMPPVAAEKVRAVPLPGNLVRIRSIMAGLPKGLRERLSHGEQVRGKDLPSTTLASLRAFIRESVTEPEWVEDCEAVLSDSSIQLRFNPQLLPYTLIGDVMPGEWAVHLSTRGKGETFTPHWTQAAGWAGLVAAPKKISPPALPQERVVVTAGLYNLEDILDRIGNSVGAKFYVEPKYAGRQVYLNLLPMPANRLIGLLVDVCNFDILKAEDGVLLGAATNYGDLLRLHRRNLTWLLKFLKPLTAVPKDSVAGKLARVCLPSNEVKFEELPVTLQKFLSPRLPQSGQTCMLRLRPAFKLRFCGHIHTISIGF